MSRRYDMVVVGAGIHGAGMAQAAAAAGHTVLVLEREAIAAGTSSRSTKLIHGGLRYLETGQIGLVRECLRERALLLELAPSLVRLTTVHIPVYAGARRSPWKIRAGLSLYAAVGGFGPANRFDTVSRRDWDTLDGLETRGLEAVFRYQEAQTDDSRLTRAVIASAEALGAEVLVPAELRSATLTASGCRVRYIHRGQEDECEATVLVNAAGPWASGVLARISPRVTPPPVTLVQGTHLVLDGRLEKGIYYMEAPGDGRAVFALPWQGRILLGTTETPFEGDPGSAAPLPEERSYLLETLAHAFPARRTETGTRVIEAWSGLRVLPGSPGAPAFGRPRDVLLHTDRDPHPRLLTLFGGKLTAYRATAERAMRRLRGSLPARKPRAATSELPLKAD